MQDNYDDRLAGTLCAAIVLFVTAPTAPTREGGDLVALLRTQRRIVRERADLLIRMTESPVVLSAPHNKASFRSGGYKPRDHNVGVIAAEAARLSGTCALLPVTPGDDDGNWCDDSRYRRTLFAVLDNDAAVIDVHGMTDAHGFDVIVGTSGGTTPTWLSDIVAGVLSEGETSFDVRAKGALSAGGRTITAACNAAGFAAVQIEIARRFRNGTDDARMSAIIDALAEIARRSDRHISALRRDTGPTRTA